VRLPGVERQEQGRARGRSAQLEPGELEDGFCLSDDFSDDEPPELSVSFVSPSDVDPDDVDSVSDEEPLPDPDASRPAEGLDDPLRLSVL